MCSAHATVRRLLEGLRLGAEQVTVTDLEAGLEHLSRGTAGSVDGMVVVMEPYFRSMETGRRTMDLSAELGIGRSWVVANKIRTPGDRESLEGYCGKHGLDLVACVPYDDALAEAERQGRSPFDHDAGSPAVREISKLVGELKKRLDG